MNDPEDCLADWDSLRDAEGELGRVGPLVEFIVDQAARGQLVETEPLADILLIPGVLCSAAPRVVSDFLTAIPKATARTKRDLLAVIFDLSETASSPRQESIKLHSDGAIAPYSSYDRLRSCVISAIQSGERYYRSEFAGGRRKRVTEREIFAAVLLSRCDAADSTLLDIYDAAIATEDNLRNQALMFIAAANIADRYGIRERYLSQYIKGTHDTQRLSVTRLLSAIYLAESLSEADLRAL